MAQVAVSEEGHEYFSQRLVLSLLSGKAVRIDKIRSDDQNPGLRGGFPLLLVLGGYLT